MIRQVAVEVHDSEHGLPEVTAALEGHGFQVHSDPKKMKDASGGNHMVYARRDRS
jgi:hypothetical protein